MPPPQHMHTLPFWIERWANVHRLQPSQLVRLEGCSWNALDEIYRFRLSRRDMYHNRSNPLQAEWQCYLDPSQLDTNGSGSILFVALHCCRRTRSSEMVEGGGGMHITMGATSFKQTSLTCNIHNSKKHCSRFDDFATIKILSTRSMVFAEGNVISFEIFITRRVEGGGNTYVHVLYFAFEACGKQNK